MDRLPDSPPSSETMSPSSSAEAATNRNDSESPHAADDDLTDTANTGGTEQADGNTRDTDPAQEEGNTEEIAVPAVYDSELEDMLNQRAEQQKSAEKDAADATQEQEQEAQVQAAEVIETTPTTQAEELGSDNQATDQPRQPDTTIVPAPVNDAKKTSHRAVAPDEHGEANAEPEGVTPPYDSDIEDMLKQQRAPAEQSAGEEQGERAEIPPAQSTTEAEDNPASMGDETSLPAGQDDSDRPYDSDLEDMLEQRPDATAPQVRDDGPPADDSLEPPDKPIVDTDKQAPDAPQAVDQIKKKPEPVAKPEPEKHPEAVIPPPQKTPPQAPGETDKERPPTEEPAAQTKPEAAPAEPARAEKGSKRWRWDWIKKQEQWGFEGLRYTGKYGLLGMKAGGRIITDAGLLWQQHRLDDAYPDFTGSAANLRSAQVQLAGYFGPYIVFKLQGELAPDVRGFKDAFVVFQEIPYVANLRLGIGKQPFSMENLTSFKFIPFMERSLMNALAPGRSFGALVNNNFFARRLSLAAGIFYRSATWADFDFDSSKGIDFSARLSALPVVLDDTTLMHMGISLLRRNHVGDINFGSRPETRLTDTTYVDTGDLDADATFALGLEFAWQKESLALLGEYTRTTIVNNGGPEPVFSSGYLTLDYILTGERRRYASASGTFGSITPAQPFSWGKDNGSGALEAALRLSYIDLDSDDIQGGREHNITAALNWYPRAKFRFSVNYTHGFVRSVADGRTNILQGRFQYEF